MAGLEGSGEVFLICKQMARMSGSISASVSDTWRHVGPLVTVRGGGLEDVARSQASWVWPSLRDKHGDTWSSEAVERTLGEVTFPLV